jgi:hypothetical protein
MIMAISIMTVCVKKLSISTQHYYYTLYDYNQHYILLFLPAVLILSECYFHSIIAIMSRVVLLNVAAPEEIYEDK